jgi:hypothetical protein
MRKLVSLHVPWMVSPSMPSLKLMSEENGDTVLQFVGLFLCEQEVASSAHAGTSGSSIGVGLRGVTLDPSNKGGRYQLIDLTFKGVGWLRRSPQHSDREVVEEAAFDWTGIKGRKRADEEIGDWVQRCDHECRSTGISPDPSAYLVSNSDWYANEAARWGLKHYLVLGESISIEVLASDIKWESRGALHGC